MEQRLHLELYISRLYYSTINRAISKDNSSLQPQQSIALSGRLTTYLEIAVYDGLVVEVFDGLEQGPHEVSSLFFAVGCFRHYPVK